MAKVARIQISKEYFEMFLRADFGTRPNTTLSSDAPKDLEVIGLAYPEGYQGYPGTLTIYIKSDDFDEVPEGQEPPLIEPYHYTVHHG